MNHTPTRSRLPWKLSRGWKPSRGNKIHAKKFALLTSDAQQAADGMLTRGVAVAVGINPKDAAFIVRACNAYEKTLEALNLHLKFLDSLPDGWLGKTTGDVGLLNDAYIASSSALKLAKGE